MENVHDSLAGKLIKKQKFKVSTDPYTMYSEYSVYCTLCALNTLCTVRR